MFGYYLLLSIQLMTTDELPHQGCDRISHPCELGLMAL